jgi:peptidoglycan/xylan/chitin deacetylase (PgdA/CDA1 family)
MDIKHYFVQARRRWSGRVLRFLPLWLLQRLFPEPMICLCYHIVSDEPLPHLKHYKFLTTTEFERDLNYLESRFRYASYDQIAEGTGEARKTSGTSVCLTFDDGFAECFTVVRPVLLRHRATCIFFIVTDLIDNHAVFFESRAALCVDAVGRRQIGEVEAIVHEIGVGDRLREAERTFRGVVPKEMSRYWSEFDERLRPLLVWLLMTTPHDIELLDRLCQRLNINVEDYVKKRQPYLSKEQILQLRSDGFTIGAHSCSHRRLQHLSIDAAGHEIVESCRVIRDLTGQESVPFAFPYFGGGLDRLWLAKLREQHPFVGLFFDTQGQRPDAAIVVQRMFGERIEEGGSLDRILRRGWSKRFL